MRSLRLRAASAVLVSSTFLLAGLITGCGGTNSSAGADPTTAAAAADGNVFADRAQTLVTNPRLVAAAKQTAADGDAAGAAVLERLATVPTGIWLTPERYDTLNVGAYVTQVLASASDQTVPLFVLYGIPDRDCTGGFSEGGLTTPEEYLRWVQAIAMAAGTGGSPTAAILEPDALAGSVSCGTDDRVRLLHNALEALVGAGVTTYVDAGHSDWIAAPEMAQLLREVGIEDARGFATNVSNYQPEARERAFATKLSGLLDDAHYVIDIGRDGDPSGLGEAVEDWCNPPDRALGPEPGFVADGSALDALLWIKPPAESDGECHGGPPAGEIWAKRAVQLGLAAGW